MRGTRGLGAAVVGTAAIAGLGSAVLAVDNLLGFVDARLLGLGVAPVVAVTVALVGAACVVLSLLTRDVARGIGAASVVGFVSTLSPALATTTWLPTIVPWYTLVPLGFLATAVVAWRGAVQGRVRTTAVVVAVLAVGWVVGASVPSVPFVLEGFLAVQAATLLAATVLLADPVLRRIGGSARSLWDSAAIR